MKRILPLSLIVITALVLAACGSSASREEVTTDFYSIGGAPMAPEAMPAESFAMPMATAGPSYDAVTANDGSNASAAQVERIVIQNADLAIVVSDVKGRMQNIQVMAQQMGGFVV